MSVCHCKHPPAASPFSPAFRALGSKPGTKVTARSSLIMGWFPCAAAVLGSPNAQGKPAQHIHLPLGGRTAPGKARSGRRFLGTNGAPKTHQIEYFLVFGNFFFKTPFPGQISVPTSFVSLFIFYILSYLHAKTTAAFLGA